MVDTANRTFVSSVLFLDIVEYSKQSVTDQLTLKQRFNDLLVDALKHVAVSDRIVLDTGDGAAVSFQGNPEDSLFAGMHMRDAVAASVTTTPILAVRFGINLGPVRLIKDINGQLNIIGDGINAAQRVMSFADPGTILVSRSYFEVVSRLSDDYAEIFQDAGTRTDKHVREHSVYAIGKTLGSGAGNQLGVAIEESASPPLADPVTATAARSAVLPATTSATGKRWWLGAGGTLLVLIVIGIGMRKSHEDALAPANKLPSPSTAAHLRAEPAAVTPATAAATPAKIAGTADTKPRDSNPPAGNHGPTAAGAKSSVVLSITPWGEVYVDGKKKGVSPPLKALSLKPGTHTIEVKNTTFPAMVKTIITKPGVETRIQYKF